MEEVIALTPEQLDNTKYLLLMELHKRSIPVSDMEFSYIQGNFYVTTEAFRVTPAIFHYCHLDAVSTLVQKHGDKTQISVQLMLNCFDFTGANYPKPFITLTLFTDSNGNIISKVVSDD